MKHYIVDGNNVIHKIKSLYRIIKKDKQAPREKLILMVENYFHGRKAKITVHFDGYVNLPIRTSIAKIIYSEKKTADDTIKFQIEGEKNRKNLIIVTSDDGIKNFARKCYCEVISSEEFIKLLQSRGNADDEAARIESMNNTEYFIKLFKADKD